MNPQLQPQLANQWVSLRPLQAEDFDPLYAVASDPLLWEQHPNPDRYKKEVFENYFTGAMESKGALLISSAISHQIIGCSRYYDHFPEQHEIKIGYTFISRTCWGLPYNRAAKTLMLKHAFEFVDEVIFHVGEHNQRSRRAMTKLGAEIIGEEMVTYYGESPKKNVVFRICKSKWKAEKNITE